jgi:hypothetical protein
MAARHHRRQSRTTRQGRTGKGACTSMAPRPPITVAYELDPADMALRGRLGAFVLHSRYDPRETTRKARQAFEERFLREVDPDGVLPEAERLRRAAAARRAYFARIALKSVRARRAARRRRLADAERKAGGGRG